MKKKKQIKKLKQENLKLKQQLDLALDTLDMGWSSGLEALVSIKTFECDYTQDIGESLDSFVKDLAGFSRRLEDRSKKEEFIKKLLPMYRFTFLQIESVYDQFDEKDIKGVLDLCSVFGFDPSSLKRKKS